MKRSIWFVAVPLLVFAFPLQVYVNNQYPCLLAYLISGPLIFTVLQQKRQLGMNVSNAPNTSNIKTVVSAYVFLVCLYTFAQLVLSVASFAMACSSITVYALPTFFYWYFCRIASEREIRAVWLAMAVAGLVCGFFFAYESYFKIGHEQVSEYARAAFTYRLMRSEDNPDDANSFSITPGQRAFGILESHTVSGAWTALGAIAALAFVPHQRHMLRQVIIGTYGLLIFLGMNYTNIIAFIIIVMHVEYDMFTSLKRVRQSFAGTIALLLICGSFLGLRAVMAEGDSFFGFLLSTLIDQSKLIVGAGDRETGYATLIPEYLVRYRLHLGDYPLALLIGDGFTVNNGMPKGGDIGWVESLSRFGVPFFIVVVVGLVKLVRAASAQVRMMRKGFISGLDVDRVKKLEFAVLVVLVILVNELHYTVWNAKSVLPILFFALALFDRYLVPSRVLSGAITKHGTHLVRKQAH